MTFDWIAFFDQRGIPYRTDGPNVAKGRCVIKCPFCGSADPSEHMSVALNGAGWRCWRNNEHAGRKPHRLLMALGLTPREADAAVGEAAPALSDDVAAQVRRILEPPPDADARPGPLALPPEFRPLARTFVAMPYVGYLARRGLTLAQVKPFGLYFAISGDFAGRVIFPVRDARGRLMGWTGRAVGRNPLRYKEAGAVKDYLWREDAWAGRGDADTLVVTEGPFDAAKVCALGRLSGIDSTCVFTSYPTARQLTTLLLAGQRFRRVVALFDAGNETAAFRLAEVLPCVRAAVLPPGVKDPGELKDLAFLGR